MQEGDDGCNSCHRNHLGSTAEATFHHGHGNTGAQSSCAKGGSALIFKTVVRNILISERLDLDFGALQGGVFTVSDCHQVWW